jgi:hypothetical protein
VHDARLASRSLQIERSDAPDLFVDITITIVRIVDIVGPPFEPTFSLVMRCVGAHVAAPILPGQGSVLFVDQPLPMRARGSATVAY